MTNLLQALLIALVVVVVAALVQWLAEELEVSNLLVALVLTAIVLVIDHFSGRRLLR